MVPSTVNATLVNTAAAMSNAAVSLRFMTLLPRMPVDELTDARGSLPHIGQGKPYQVLAYPPELRCRHRVVRKLVGIRGFAVDEVLAGHAERLGRSGKIDRSVRAS